MVPLNCTSGPGYCWAQSPKLFSTRFFLAKSTNARKWKFPKYVYTKEVWDNHKSKVWAWQSPTISLFFSRAWIGHLHVVISPWVLVGWLDKVFRLWKNNVAKAIILRLSRLRMPLYWGKASYSLCLRQDLKCHKSTFKF
jgi:hypothetical protein